LAVIQTFVLGLGGRVKAGLAIVWGILGAANVILFIILISGLSPVAPDGGAINSYDAISTQITILGVILGAVAIGLAAAAFFGYQALEGVMLRRADDLWNQRLENLQRSQPPEASGPTPGPGPTPQTQAEEEQNL
jgi:hypothetical protein